MTRAADKTPWFPSSVRPARVGMYEVQDKSMNCNCCWIEIHWTGRELSLEARGLGVKG